MNMPNDVAFESAVLPLAFGLRFADLYDREGLAKVDAAFLDFLRDTPLRGRPERSTIFAGQTER